MIYLKKTIIYSISIFIFLIGLNVHAKTLTLEQYLTLIKANDSEFKVLKLEAEKANYFIDENLPSRAVLLSIENENGFSNDDSKTNKISTTLSKKVLETGTIFSTTHTLNDKSESKENITKFRFEQSLLKNFMGKKSRLQKLSLEKKKNILELETQERIENYLRDKIKLYLDFVHATYDLRLAKQLHRDAKKLHQFVLDKLNKNVANRTDLKRISLQIILREEEILKKEANFDSLKKKIMAISGFDGADIEPEYDLLLNKKYPFHVNDFIPSRYRHYAIAAQSKRAHFFEREFAKRAQYPGLSLLAGYDIDNSKGLLSDTNNRAAVIGLKFSISLGDSKVDAQSNIANLNFLKSESMYRKKEQALRVLYNDFKQRLKKIEKKLKLGRSKIELIADILKEDNRRYRVGKIDLDKIIENNNDYAQYQFQHSQNRIEFNKIYADWLSFNDELVKFEGRKEL